jgi:hypothetical protein
MPTPPSNPFAAYRFAPGAMPFQFPPGESAAALVERLKELRWRAGIVGPHGTGKSTLLAELLPQIDAAGREPVLIVLHRGEPSPVRLSRLLDRLQAPEKALLAVDGYELLSPWQRWAVQRRTRRRGCGLLATSHRPLGLPVLWRTGVDLPLALRLVQRLLQGTVPPAGLSLERTVESLLFQHRGNLREVLFALHDLFRPLRIPQGGPAAPVPAAGADPRRATAGPPAAISSRPMVDTSSCSEDDSCQPPSCAFSG